ncbi:MAG TPA: DUF6157 family protein [Pirellulaceae bacterium]|jgi:hypothetical protein|nr:DUF6157 family protein [Pirellulaceae bacterium]
MSYVDTFIIVAPDSDLERAVVPTARGEKKTIAQLEHELLSNAPYRYTEAEAQFAVHLARLGLPPLEEDARRASLEREFFSTSRACLRASPLPKKFGWGIHYDANGRIAIYAVESDDYRRLANDPSLKQLAAMRSSRA